ncbi:NAD(P)H-quinone oxidoreductase [Frankia sp. CNm7]|uniref:NAD(P)H-quinone oxidoreductase n=1 Tax=Frankia nepalensis TaxID=1836974 RepID=A0A937RUV5_9ACTN|nr:NAD(P)H-quinone oxidoreductase [Frankia nepalensis]MBL7496281.1 NAD(P)H-quinone oxidoreductase [Frankia nepalensis]MBL7513827.1 NAD(P)H-quinone oxidoreductase [Frankia nepalensis]MBL7517566.1 NAD(P)H-quinone oxidoreductase [Frankia nepalensis]MBL7633744.1 NAD(P)H-quinone oxidoreductase [Frankia nepalensis]
MYAVTMKAPGGPEVLEWREVDDPVGPAPGELAIDVVATAVNRADLLQRQGNYAPPPGASEILGLECSGRVAAVGPGVDGWRVGDEVCALLAGGGYATRVVVPAGQALPVPGGVDLVTAGGLPEVASTVYSTVFGRAALADGETFLVHGGASGIGTFAIQAARALRPKSLIATTAGTPAKLARCRELGADVAISYRDDDFVARVREATGGRGADVILDNMGAKYLARNVDALAPDGRLVVIGLQGGIRAELNLAALLAKRGAVHAISLRHRPEAQKAAIVAGVRAELWPAFASGAIRPVVDRVLPLPEAAEAHRVVESLGHVGKVLLAVPGA